jgi:tryptophan-rich sensory protein
MSLSGSTLTIVLGTTSGSVKTETAKKKPVWTPVATIFDLAWNACSTSAVTANKKLF